MRSMTSPLLLTVAASPTGMARNSASKMAASCINLLVIVDSISLFLMMCAIDTHFQTW